MPRVPVLLAVLALFADAYPVRAAAPTTWNCTEHGTGGIRVCTHLDASALSGPGRSTTWWIRLEGGDIRSQARLHNSSPGVVRLERGNDQIVHMGCRRHRQVRRQVTVIGTGEPKLEARPYFASPKQEAAAIAADLAVRLAEIEARFIKRRAELPSEYSAEAVAELLKTTEDELIEALGYEELAALRDYVREEFRKAREDLEESPIEASIDDTRFVFDPQTVLASLSGLHLPQDATRPDAGSRPGTNFRSKANPVLDRIGTKVLHGLTGMAEDEELLISVCVTSEPGDSARVLLRPKSISNWTIDTTTTGALPTLYRGIYVYKASRGIGKYMSCENPRKQGCAPLDLVTLPLFNIHCHLIDKKCNLRSGPPPANGCRNYGS